METKDKFLGYSISELLTACMPVTCPECKENNWQFFISPNGENFVILCLHCRHVLSLKEILHTGKERAEK